VFKYLLLIYASVSWNWARTICAFAAVSLSFTLFAVLETIRFQIDQPFPNDELVMVRSRTPDFTQSHVDVIRSLNGVRAATSVSFLTAQGSTASETITLGAVDHEDFLSTFAHADFEGVERLWLNTRIAALCEATTVARNNWRVNDLVSIALRPGNHTRRGTRFLEVRIVGTYMRRTVPPNCVVHRNYLLEELGSSLSISNIYVRTNAASLTTEIAREIDTRFVASAQTESAPWNSFAQRHAENARAIRLLIVGTLSITFFTMMVITGSALSQSIRERTGELAVLSALGYPPSNLVLLVFMEAFVILIGGSVVGLSASQAGLSLGVYSLPSGSSVLPVNTALYAGGLALMFAIGSVALPCMEILRLRTAEALHRL
jgi:putative ABC transport system permease protein